MKPRADTHTRADTKTRTGTRTAQSASASATVDGDSVRTVPGEGTLSLAEREKLNL